MRVLVVETRGLGHRIRIARCSTKALVYFAKVEWRRESRRHNNKPCPTSLFAYPFLQYGQQEAP